MNGCALRSVGPALVLAALLGLGLWYRAGPGPGGRVDLPPLTSCDLGAGPCTATLPDGSLARVDASPRPVTALSPIAFHAAVQGGDWVPTGLELTGADMDMGVARVALRPDGAGGAYVGDGIVPVCTRREMTWRLLLVLDSAQGSLGQPFPMTVQRP